MDRASLPPQAPQSELDSKACVLIVVDNVFRDQEHWRPPNMNLIWLSNVE
jgi:hypothetical protein